MGERMKTFAVMALALAVAGCETINVLTYSDDKSSYQFVDEITQVQLVFPDAPGKPKSHTVFGDDVPAASPLGQALQKCGAPIKEPPPDKGVAFLPPLLGPVIVTGAGIAVNALIDVVSNAIDQKKKEFKRTYSASVNLGNFDLSGDAAGVRCILVQRLVAKPDATGTAKKGGEQTTAMRAVFQFKPLCTDGAVGLCRRGSDIAGFVLAPTYLEMIYPAARTSSASHAVDVDIALAISATKASKPGEPASIAVLTAPTYSIKGVKRRVSGSKEAKDDDSGVITCPAPGPGPAVPKPCRLPDSSIIVPLKGPQAATVTVAVTETGDGADDFGKLKTDIDANKTAIKDLSLNLLKQLLGLK
jgi:hypothetical protein